MKEIEEIKKEFTDEIKDVHTSENLDQIKTKFLGKQGKINQLFRTLPIKSDPKIGKQINDLKVILESELSTVLSKILKSKEEDTADVTIPGHQIPEGSQHLISQAIQEIEMIFTGLGFVRRRYPEVETDWYYAEGLNIPKDHPARDDQETFYVTDNTVLTAHTSNGQLREMELKKSPPIKMINIGKTYRRQIDATHTPMFHQFEGLMVGPDVSVAHMKAIMSAAMRELISPDIEFRFRTSYFPFVEPGLEVDMRFMNKKSVQSSSRWLEVVGCGLIHPNVLKNVKIGRAHV